MDSPQRGAQLHHSTVQRFAIGLPLDELPSEFCMQEKVKAHALLLTISFLPLPFTTIHVLYLWVFLGSFPSLT